MATTRYGNNRSIHEDAAAHICQRRPSLTVKQSGSFASQNTGAECNDLHPSRGICIYPKCTHWHVAQLLGLYKLTRGGLCILEKWEIGEEMVSMLAPRIVF